MPRRKTSDSPMLAPPLITKIRPVGEAIFHLGTSVVVSGRRLHGDATHVLINGHQIQIDNSNASGTSLRIKLDGDFLRSGINSLCVLRETQAGMPPETLSALSNAVDFILTPVISSVFSDVGDGRIWQVYLTTDILIRDEDVAHLLLNESRLQMSYSLPVAGEMKHGKQIIVPVSNVRAGTYLVRLVVNGVSTALEMDTTPNSPSYGRFIGPQVTIQ
jgi:hypothetical protein